MRVNHPGAGGAMAEVGLLPFARVALQVCKAVLPQYWSRFSKRLFHPDGFPANTDRAGAGRRRVRQREESHLSGNNSARVIPAKRGKKTWRIHGVRAEMRRAFPGRIYRRRALIETLFSSIKRKLSARAPGRTLPMQKRQAVLLGLSFNLYRLRHRRLFPRMSTVPRHLINAS